MGLCRFFSFSGFFCVKMRSLSQTMHKAGILNQECYLGSKARSSRSNLKPVLPEDIQLPYFIKSNMPSIATHDIVLGTIQKRKIQSLWHNAFLSLEFSSKISHWNSTFRLILGMQFLFYPLFTRNAKGYMENKSRFTSKLHHTQSSWVTLNRLV